MRTGNDRSNCMISLMNEDFQPKIRAIINELQAAGWQAVVHESRRNKAQQEKKCRDGHSKTMCSKHMCDRAADIIDRRYAWNIAKSHDFWKALGNAPLESKALFGAGTGRVSKTSLTLNRARVSSLTFGSMG